METKKLEEKINIIWENRENITPDINDDGRQIIEETLKLLDTGKIRVAEKIKNVWVTNELCKKANNYS